MSEPLSPIEQAREYIKRVALPEGVLVRYKSDTLHYPPPPDTAFTYGEEFAPLTDHPYGLTEVAQDLVDLALIVPDLLAAYDAQSARIAELESPAHRARIAREFYEEVMTGAPDGGLYQELDDTLERWEAAAKGSVEP